MPRSITKRIDVYCSNCGEVIGKNLPLVGGSLVTLFAAGFTALEISNHLKVSSKPPKECEIWDLGYKESKGPMQMSMLDMMGDIKARLKAAHNEPVHHDPPICCNEPAKGADGVIYRCPFYLMVGGLSGLCPQSEKHVLDPANKCVCGHFRTRHSPADRHCVESGCVCKRWEWEGVTTIAGLTAIHREEKPAHNEPVQECCMRATQGLTDGLQIECIGCGRRWKRDGNTIGRVQ